MGGAPGGEKSATQHNDARMLSFVLSGTERAGMMTRTVFRNKFSVQVPLFAQS